ncbi:MAG: hypothetical protein ACOY99_12160 [Pseudomonadota bacterium]
MPSWVLFFVVVIGIPVVFGTLADVYKRHIRHKERALELQASLATENSETWRARVERLEQRVRVLERIVTDKGHHLAEEIEKLRDKPLN